MKEMKAGLFFYEPPSCQSTTVHTLYLADNPASPAERKAVPLSRFSVGGAAGHLEITNGSAACRWLRKLVFVNLFLNRCRPE